MFSMEITRLIERCRQGDADALGELYKAYAQRMRGVCRRYVSDEQAVDDVLHDAFVIIFTSFDRLRDARKAESWMMAITRNVASKYKDHLAALPTVPIEEAVNIAAPNEDTAVRGIPLAEVMRMIDRLPEGYAKVFRLSVFEGMSHKEIAALLGIEPHSSSSQLTRAKKMLQKSLAQYWMLWLLPLLLPVAFYLYKYQQSDREIADVTISTDKQKQEEKKQQEETDMDVHPVHSIYAKTPQTMSSEPTATWPHTTDSILHTDTLQYIAETETTTIPQEQNTPSIQQRHTDVSSAETGRQPFIPQSKDVPMRWGIDFAYSGDFNKVDDTNTPASLWGQVATDITSGEGQTTMWEIKNWSEYVGYLYDADMTEEEREPRLKIAEDNMERGEDEIRRSTHHDLPVTISLALRRQISPQWSVETGVHYTRLSSQFTTGLPQAGFVDVQKIHYLGIPLSIAYQWASTKHWSLYSSFGATLDIPVSSTFATDYRLNGVSLREDHHSFHAPLQWSVGTGVGLQYSITPNIGLFAEPRLQYFIPTGTSIETYRTEHPFDLSLPFGIRFTW